MKNRAKCKLCESIIESFHSTDYVSCKCGEISVDGGEALRCFANDFNNFLRIDDDGNEVIVLIKDHGSNAEVIPVTITKKQDLIKELEEMIKSIEKLPRHAMDSPITHADFCSLMMLLSAIFKA